jgi:glycine oxidase
MSTVQADVAIVGAGVIGAGIAWRCAQHGLSVALADPDPDRGAWSTAAGLLAPISELVYTETPLLRLNLDSLARYGGFVAELTDETGIALDYRESGTVETAWDAADLATLRELHAFHASLGLKSELLDARELRRLEPSLAAGIPGGLLAADERHVNPRLLRSALAVAAQAHGAVLHVGEAAVDTAGDRATGLRLADGTRIAAEHVVLAAGAWSGRVAGLPPGLAPPVRPVKGQTMVLRLDGPERLRHVLRGKVKGNHIYLLPRADGRIAIGASVEEKGFDQQPRAGAIYELLRDAQTLIPELSEAVLDGLSTGLRPGSPDNAPLIGPSTLPGLTIATGHYRNGVLLTPVTADAVAEYVTAGTLPAVVAPFGPDRFAG